MADADKVHLENLKREEKFLMQLQEKFQKQMKSLKIEEAALLKLIRNKGQKNPSGLDLTFGENSGQNESVAIANNRNEESSTEEKHTPGEKQDLKPEAESEMIQ